MGHPPGFPYGGVYHGWDSVGRDFFGRRLADYESFRPGAEQFYVDDEGHVTVYGHYHATPRAGGAGDGKLTRLLQTADTYVLRQAHGA